MQEIVLKIRYFERGLSENFEKVNFFFVSSPIPLDEQDAKRGA